MKREFLSFVVLWFAATFGATCQDASITVKVKYSENGKIIPNTGVY